MSDLPSAPFALPDAATHRRSPFSASLHNFQTAWDSTSLGLIKECPRKYYYQIIQGWQSKHFSVHLKFGQLYHAALEAYDHHAASLGKLEGGLTDDEHHEGVRVALLRALKESGTYSQPTCVTCGGTGKVPLHPDRPDLTDTWHNCEVCAGTGKIGEKTWEPWRSEDPYKNIWTLCRSIVWYCDHFRHDQLHTVVLSNGKPAVELSFYFDIGDVAGNPIGMCGHLDRVTASPADNFRKSIQDRKTTKGQLNANFWQGFNPHNQFTLYTAAGALHYEQPTWGITVDAVQVLVNSSSFQRQFIPYPPALVNEFMVEAKYYIGQAAEFAAASFWPKNDKSCGSYGGCAFRRVCSKAPSFRQAWLEADFTTFRWNPLEVRGDI